MNFRSSQETLILKLLIWQAYFVEEGPPPRQIVLARQLRVSQPYVSRVQRTAEAMAELSRHGRVTLADLQRARRYRRDPQASAP
jgi:hypothetical protein